MNELPLRDDLRGETPYGAPQLDVPVALNVNENPYPPSPSLISDVAAAVAAVTGSLNRYPDREASALRADLAGYLAEFERVSFDSSMIWAANGSNEVMHQLLLAFGGPGRTVLGFAGSFYAYEGLDLLLDAFARLAPARPDVAVLLLGGGPQEQALRERAAALGVAGRVIFAGRVPHQDVNRYYDLIDVLVYPRHRMRLTELVTPLKPLEAMAQGRIVLASDVGGHLELVRHRENGYLFAAGDVDALARAIVDVLDRREEWPRIARTARAYVETERNWTVSVARYEPIYRRLAAGAGRVGLAESRQA